MVKVVNILKKFEAETSESVLDRAHSIGPTYTDNNAGKNCQSIFVSSRHLDIEPYFIQITKRLSMVFELD